MTTKNAAITSDITRNNSTINDIAPSDVIEVPETVVRRFIALHTPLERIQEILVANQGTVSVSNFDRIKIPAGGSTSWTVPDIAGEQIVKELSGVILTWREIRTYWPRSLEQSEGNTPPDCYSMDARTGIGSPGGNCHNCRLAQFSSDAKGDRPACKLYRQLLFLREENLLPEIVSLPVSSIKPVRDYFNRLGKKGLPSYGVISKIGLEKVRSAQGIEYSRATFTAGELLPPEFEHRARDYGERLRSFFETAPPTPVSQEDKGEII